MVELGIALVALTVMEIVLGIDNIVFISIQSSKLPVEQRARARWIGLAAAMGTRIALLFTINWIMQLTQPFFHFSDLGFGKQWLEEHKLVNELSAKDLVLLAGGLFLLHSSVREIHHNVEGLGEDAHANRAGSASFVSVIIQIAILDIIFSLDSVITAVGMVQSGEDAHPGGIYVMIIAIVLAVLVMMFFAGPVSAFVEKHPTVKMLALSFLLLIAVMLIAEAAGTHIEKGYIYFAMGFSLMVEFLNLRAKAKRKKKRQGEVGKKIST